jgi:hypothetical protein
MIVTLGEPTEGSRKDELRRPCLPRKYRAARTSLAYRDRAFYGVGPSSRSGAPHSVGLLLIP